MTGRIERTRARVPCISRNSCLTPYLLRPPNKARSEHHLGHASGRRRVLIATGMDDALRGSSLKAACRTRCRWGGGVAEEVAGDLPLLHGGLLHASHREPLGQM